MWRGDCRFLRPWVLGGAVWLTLSVQVLSAYVRQAGSEHLAEIGFLLSLLWAQFGFAGLFHCLRHRQGRGLGPLLLVMLMPLLALYLLVLWFAAR